MNRLRILWHLSALTVRGHVRWSPPARWTLTPKGIRHYEAALRYLRGRPR